MVLRQMVGVKAAFFDEFDELQARFEKAAQRRAIAVEMIENAEAQHALALRDANPK